MIRGSAKTLYLSNGANVEMTGHEKNWRWGENFAPVDLQEAVHALNEKHGEFKWKIKALFSASNCPPEWKGRVEFKRTDTTLKPPEGKGY